MMKLESLYTSAEGDLTLRFVIPASDVMESIEAAKILNKILCDRHSNKKIEMSSEIALDLLIESSGRHAIREARETMRKNIELLNFSLGTTTRS